jgi:phosphoribosyl-ATP pyrophosphohydrolase
VQGVMTLYSIDTASNGLATGKIFEESAAAVQTAATPTELTASPDAQRLIDQLSHETADIGYHVRSLMSAFAASLDALSIANSRQSLRILQNAAIAVCMKAMIEQPDKAREFEETFLIIKKVV